MPSSDPQKLLATAKAHAELMAQIADESDKRAKAALAYTLRLLKFVSFQTILLALLAVMFLFSNDLWATPFFVGFIAADLIAWQVIMKKEKKGDDDN